MGTQSGSVASSEGPGADEENAAYRTDAFRMQCMKVLPCSKRYVHDWTECPFAHPQEKARRRDPRVYNYTGIACPNMKKDGTCPLREHCPYAHNVFEYWLHPTRYRTQLCNDGPNCQRKICFFAHSLEELRVPVTKPFVSPESLASASAAVAAEDGARRHSGGSFHQVSSPRAGIMERSDSGMSHSSLEPSGSNGGGREATTATSKVSIPGSTGPEASQQLAVVEMVAGLLRQGRLTAAQASTILQQSLGPGPPTPRDSFSSDQQTQFLGTPARNPGRVLSRQLSNRSSSSVGSVGPPLGTSPSTAPVLELNSTRLSDPMGALFSASTQSSAQALSEQLARLQLVQSLSSLHQHQHQLAAVQAAAGWDSTRGIPPLRSSSGGLGLDSSRGMEDYSNIALAALQQQAAALGGVSSGQAPPVVRSSGHDLAPVGNSARLSLDANRYDDHEATLFNGLPAHLRAGHSPELANAYASSFFSTQPDLAQRPSDVESGQTEHEATSPTNDAPPSPAALWAALSSIRGLETGETSGLHGSS